MLPEQICQLLLQTTVNQVHLGGHNKSDLQHGNLLTFSDDNITAKLYQILETLQEQKNQFALKKQQLQQKEIQKINYEKDQIIEDLLKSIYNIKRENQQLKFQYRKRFKVIKNMQEKHEKLIESKNKKITSLESVVKYLQHKIKHLQKKFGQFEGHLKKEWTCKNHNILSKSRDNYFSPNKFSPIVSKSRLSAFDLFRNFNNKNSMQDLTIPLSQSFLSASKLSWSSKTIAKNRDKGDYNQNYISRKAQKKQSGMHQSFLTFIENNIDQKYIETDTNIGDNSSVVPVRLEKFPQISITKYLTLNDLNDLQRNSSINVENQMRKSQRLNPAIFHQRWNRQRENY